MTYGRYEKGEREPSYPSVSYIAQIFHCNIDFLYGTSDVMNCDYIVISRSESPELYSLVEDRILAYARELNRKEKRG